jgi:hypothetical protein
VGLALAALLPARAQAQAETAPPAAPGPCPCAEIPPSGRVLSLWTAPPRPRGLTRLEIIVRPFFGLSGNTWGTVSEARVEHYFQHPFMLGAELAPLAIAHASEGTGAIAHIRVDAAWTSNALTIGFGAGVRLRRFATDDGVTLAPMLRLGPLDGFNLRLVYDDSISRNHNTGKPSLGFSNLMGTLTVPLTPGLAFLFDGGVSTDVWVYGTLGLRDRFVGEGGPGSWYVTGAFGFAWVSDRTVCNFNAVVPCPGGTALSYGPTIAAGVERRF